MNDKKTGLISIILPAYNTPEAFLREAVESVLAQTYSDWELLIIDDSTACPVEKIIASYRDGRIKYFRNSRNIGMADSRNRGLELAQGEFIALLDHDDLWLPEKLSEQIKLIQQSKCNMVYSPIIFFGNEQFNSVIQHNVSFSDLLMGHNIVSCSSVLIRAELIRRFDLKFQPEAAPADDYAMWLAVALYGGNIECNDQYLVKYRKHDNNVSGTLLACYYPYEWILKDISHRLFKTRFRLILKLKCQINILRTRAWVLRKIISEDAGQSGKDKVLMSLKSVQIWPLHPLNWLLLIKNFFQYAVMRQKL